MGDLKWQTIAAILAGILITTGAITQTDMLGAIFQLKGIEYTHSGDAYCGETCYSYLNITSSYWEVCFGNYNNTKYNDSGVLFKKVARSRTLHANLDQISKVIQTDPPIYTELKVPTYGGKWRDLVAGDCIKRGKVNRFQIVGYKEELPQVKWGFSLSDEYENEAVDPIWASYSIEGNTVYIDIAGKGYISQTPHTLTDTVNKPILNFTNNFGQTLCLDAAFGFDTDKAKPTKAEYLKWNMEHEIIVPEYGWVEKHLDCAGTYNVNYGIINSTNAWCNDLICLESPVVENDWCYWEHEYTHYLTNASGARLFYGSYEQVGSHIEYEYYNDWFDISSQFETISALGKTWYVIQDTTLEDGQTVTLKPTINVMPGESGKYDLILKRCEDSIDEAISLDRYIILDPWFNTSWSYRRNVTATKMVDATLTNFTFLLALNVSRDFGSAQADGDDLRMYDSNQNLLSYNIETWTNVAANLSYVWVKIPDSFDTTEIITIYYNNSEAENGEDVDGTWDANYKAVYHLKDVSNSADLTKNATNLGAVPTTGCKIGSCYDFEFDTTDYMNINNLADTWVGDGGTYTAWFAVEAKGATAWTTTWSFGLEGGSEQYLKLAHYYDATEKHQMQIQTPAGTTSKATTATYDGDTDWHYLSFSWDTLGKLYDLFVDGVLIGNATNTLTHDLSGVDRGFIGAWTYNHVIMQFWDGLIDELTLSSEQKSLDWMNATYQMTNNPTAYISVGEQESVPSGEEPPVVTCSQTPTPSSLINISQNNNSINLGWTDITATKYLIFRNGTNVVNDTGTPYNNTGLTQDTSYYYSLKAYNVSCTESLSNYSNNITVRTEASPIAPPPSCSQTPTPTILINTSGTNNSIYLTWSGTFADKYLIFKNDSNLINVTDEFKNYTGLTANTAYKFGVKSYNASCTNPLSNYSNNITVMTFLYETDSTPPTVYSESPEDDNNTIDINPIFCYNASESSDCILYIDTTPYGTNSSITADTSYCIGANESLSYGAHIWNVSCTDGSSNTNSSVDRTINIFACNIPPVPTSFTNISGNNNSLYFTWDAMTITEKYLLYQNTTNVHNITIGTNLFNDTGLTQNTAYKYELSGYNSSCISKESAKATALDVRTTVSPDLLAPVITLLSPVNNNKTTDTTPDFGFQSGEVASCTLWINASKYGDVGPISKDTPYSLTANASLNFGTYIWQVNCTDSSSNEGASETRNIGIYPCNKPTIPTNLNNVSATYNSIYLNWTAVTGIEKYILYRASANVANITVGTEVYNNTGLTQNTVYTYQLSAYNSTCISPEGAKSSSISPKTPYSGLQIAFSFNSMSKNITAELGSIINISANTTSGIVEIDIIHPEYGLNYTSGTSSATMLLNISYFEKETFNDGDSSKSLDYVSQDDYLFLHTTSNRSNADSYAYYSYWELENDNIDNFLFEAKLADGALQNYTGYGNCVNIGSPIIVKVTSGHDIKQMNISCYDYNTSSYHMIGTANVTPVLTASAYGCNAEIWQDDNNLATYKMYKSPNSNWCNQLTGTTNYAGRIYEVGMYQEDSVYGKVYIKSHQYDEPISLFFNLTGQYSSSPTTIILNSTIYSPADAFFDEDNTWAGNEGDMIIDVLDGTGEIAFIRYNITNLTDSTIVSASYCTWASEQADEIMEVWYVSNDTWTEANVDDWCGNGVYCSEVSDKLTFNYFNFTGVYDTGNSFFCISGFEEMLQDEINNGDNLISFAFKMNNDADAAKYYDIISKDWTGSQPYFNISYIPSQFPQNVKIYLNNTLVKSISALYNSSSISISKFNDGTSTNTITYGSNDLQIVGHLDLPNAGTVIGGTLTLIPEKVNYIDQSNTQSISSYTVNLAGASWVEQSVNISSNGNLTRVDFYTYSRVGGHTIYLDAGTTKSGKDLINNCSITLGTQPKWYNCTTANVVVTNSTTVWLKWLSLSNWAYYYKSTNPYTRGSLYISNVSFGVYDTLFKVYMDSYPRDVYLESGILQGTRDFSQSGEFNTTKIVSLNVTGMNDYLDSCTPDDYGECSIPIYSYSNGGKIRFRSLGLNYTYQVNPINISSSYIKTYLESQSGNTTIPIKITSEVPSKIIIDALKYRYKGGTDDIKVTTHDPSYTINTTYYITYYYSRFSQVLPYDWYPDLFFIGKSNNSKNISAYGQNIGIPAYNITGQSYDSSGLNFTISTDNPYACVSFTASLNNTKSVGTNLSSSEYAIKETTNLSIKYGIWLWVDLNNCASSVGRILFPNISVSSCCYQCDICN